jgi:uncharacterized protein YlzI (FlbEa/FlbD family)
MLKICYMILTLANGEPTLINFNEVVAINQVQPNIVNYAETKIYFGSGAFGTNSITIKESVEEVVEKLSQCNASENADHRWNFVAK